MSIHLVRGGVWRIGSIHSLNLKKKRVLLGYEQNLDRMEGKNS